MNTTMSLPEQLRDRMVDRIAANDTVSPAVDKAMRKVPRHVFLPAASVEDAYADQAVTTTTGPDGRPRSCASQPTIVAMMLDQLDLHPGHRVLEIGAGTGYNAALVAELVGDTGQVTTVDIHPDVADGARRALDATGYCNVRVITGDGALGGSDHAPFDRIIVTVGPWDLPPAWSDQLTPDGHLVVPLHWRGQYRSIVFTHDGDHLRSRSIRLCGFIPMVGQHAERTATIDSDGQVTLAWDTDQPHDPQVLHGVLTQPKTAVWSGATVGGYEPIDGIWLRLTATEPGTCRITATRSAVATGLCTPAIASRSPAIADNTSVAYLALRDAAGEPTHGGELGAIGHGPDGGDLAARLVDQIRVWDRDRAAQPVITAHPAHTPADQLPDGYVITRHHTHLVISYTPPR